MKKIIFAIAITMMFGFAASAQSDGFFKNIYNESYNDRTSSISDPTGLIIPNYGVGEQTGDQPAPLGSGLLILGILGAGYAVARKRETL